MTDLTFLDVVTLLLLGLMLIGGWVMLLDFLNRTDRKANRESQCPPHEWAPYYVDVQGEWGREAYQFAGLRCGKCKRTPASLSNGESWANGPWGF